MCIDMYVHESSIINLEIRCWNDFLMQLSYRFPFRRNILNVIYDISYK